jgi:hypothetical protein
MVRVPRDPKGIVVVVVVLCASTGTMLKAVPTNRAVRNFITKLLGSRALQRKTIYKRILQKLFVGILNQDDNLRSYLDDGGTTGKLPDAVQFGAVLLRLFGEKLPGAAAIIDSRYCGPTMQV